MQEVPVKSARDNEMPQLNIFRRIKNVVEQIKCYFTLQIGEESGQNVLLMVFSDLSEVGMGMERLRES